jgi:hypothetical protein
MSCVTPLRSVSRAYDFPDWVHPSLVKSLRQGLRSRVFVGSLLWAQFSTGLLVWLHASVPDGASGPGTWSMLYWLNAFLLLTVFVPLSPIFLKDEDMEPSNFDLIRLTTMDSSRSFMGRFVGLAVHAMLLLTAVLPYQLLRSFLPGVELRLDLETLAWIIANMLLLAPWGIFVGSMPLGPRVALSVLLLGALLFIFVGFLGILIDSHRSSIHSVWLPWTAIALVFGIVGFGLGNSRYELVDRQPAGSH